jgi:peptidoglycan hydrolase CwlO-like protein
MNAKKDLPIYVLSGAIVLSTLIYTSQSSSKSDDTKEQFVTSSFVTLEKYTSDIKQVLTEIVKLQNQVGGIQGCINNLEVQLGGNGREVVC